jgi:hypothetical protein
MVIYINYIYLIFTFDLFYLYSIYDIKFVNCNKIISNERYYIEYPYDTYCLEYAKKWS